MKRRMSQAQPMRSTPTFSQVTHFMNLFLPGRRARPPALAAPVPSESNPEPEPADNAGPAPPGRPPAAPAPRGSPEKLDPLPPETALLVVLPVLGVAGPIPRGSPCPPAR